MKTILSIAFLVCVNYVFGQNTIDTTKHDTIIKEPVFTFVQNMPEFPGGEKEMFNFLTSNLRFPSESESKPIKGFVYVTFIVEKDGVLSDIHILKGIAKPLDDEALRVVKLMPKWIPGKQNGNLVRVQISLPVNYKPK